MRVLVVLCPNWPVTALGLVNDVAAVLEGHRVLAASGAALECGVRRGQVRRQAEHCCPGLQFVRRDHALEARAFEPVVSAVGALCPFVEVTRPGLLALSARGPARYFGGEPRLCAQVAAAAAGALPAGVPPPRIGIAEGPFASALAARRGVVVAEGATAQFLAPLPVSVLGDPELAGLLVRLGLPSLGSFADLDEESVRERFGGEGVRAHRRARGLDDEVLRLAGPGETLQVETGFEEPVDRVDVAAFVARAMADELLAKLEERGLSCLRLAIESETEHGEALSRLWRSEGSFTAEAVLERLRWQLEGWLGGSVPEPAPTAGITLLRLVADEVGPGLGRQLGLFGGRSDADLRAARGLDRLRGLLGPGAVFTASLKGGRGPGERVAFTPWGEGSAAAGEEGPWPGRHPSPAPALVYPEPVPAEVRAGAGEPVRVLMRGVLPCEPAEISIGGGPWSEVVAWAGPWLVDERPWDPRERRRRSRFQLLTATGVAHLCVVEANRWWVEATYD